LKPIIIGKNVHLILVEEIVQPQLNESLRSQILEQLFADWLEQKLQQYSIKVKASLEPPREPSYQQST
ncbi:MAG: peptidylprolyl isomerase, partial [Pleurocapsa sp.]